jgi:site-specific recombinase XerD
MKITTAIARYLLHLKARGRAYHTLKGAKYDLRYFARFIQAAHCTCIEDITAEIIEQYHQELVFYLTAKSKPLSLRTRSQRMSVVKGFTRFLKEKEYLTADPGHAIQLPKKPRPLPKVILTAKEITRLFNAPDMPTPVIATASCFKSFTTPACAEPKWQPCDWPTWTLKAAMSMCAAAKATKTGWCRSALQPAI